MRVSRNIHRTSSTPRISIFRSSKYIYAQAIDDENRLTLCSCSSKKITSKEKMNKSKTARQVGVELAALLKEKKILKGLFDKGSIYLFGKSEASCRRIARGRIAKLIILFLNFV